MLLKHYSLGEPNTGFESPAAILKHGQFISLCIASDYSAVFMQ